MAKDNIIGLAMGLDVSDLKAGIAEVNKTIKQSKAEFENSVAGLDKWQKSSEGLSAKLKQLNSNYTSQQKIVAGYKAEIERVNSLEGDHTQQLQKLQEALVKAETNVKKTELSIKSYSDKLASARAEEQKSESSLGTLTATIKKQSDELNDLKSEYQNAVLTYGKNSKQAKALAGEIENLSDSLNSNQKELNESQKAVGRLGAEMDDTKGEASGFSRAMSGLGAVGGAFAKGLGVVVGSIGAVTGAFLETAGASKEYRTTMGKLTAGFETSGLKAEQAADTYNKLYSVVADEGKATEATAMLGQLAKSQQDLNKWVNISTGVYATFGDSLPIENLAEASLETSKTGKITGGLADALNWAGVSEEKFQKSLDECTTEQERQKLITETLNGLYGEASERYKELNKDVIDSNRAQAELTATMANFGKVAEPILTNLKVLANAFLSSLTPFVGLLGEGLQGALNGTEDASEQMAEGISGIINAIVGKVNDMLPMIARIMPLVVNSLVEQFPLIVGVIGDLAPQLVNALVQMAPTISATIVQIAAGLVDVITSLIPSLVMVVTSAIPQITTALIRGIPQLIDAGVKLLSGLIDAIPEFISGLVDALPQIIDAIVTTLLSSIPQLIEGGIELFMGLVEAIPQVVVELVKAIPQIITGIKDALIKGVPEMMQVGRELIQGLWNGIVEKFNWLVGKIKGLGKKIAKAFGFNVEIEKEVVSTFEQVGETAGENFTNGLVSSMEEGKEEVSNVANEIEGRVKELNSKAVVTLKTEVAKEKNGTWLDKIEDTLGVSKQKLDTWQKGAGGVIGKIGDYTQKAFSKATEFTNSILELFNQRVEEEKTRIDQRRDAEIKALDENLAAQTELYKNGKITSLELLKVETQTTKKKQEIEAKATAEKNKLGERVFKAQQANQIAQAVIAGALAIVQGFATLGPIGGLINMAVQAGITGAQIAVIKSQKYIPQYAKGGVVTKPQYAMIGEDGAEAVMPLEKNTGWIAKLAEQITDIMARNALTLNIPQTAVAGVSGGNVVYNYYQTINSPKALTRHEIYRDTNNLLTLKGGN